MMSIMRVCIVLGLTLATLLVVVALREETTQVHYELSRLDSREQALRQELWEKELELARLRNPMLIRARLLELRMPQAGGARP
jgi:hypothetical protein